MILVVDASAIASILFGEPEGATISAHCRGETLLAPQLIDFELANAAVKRIRRDPSREAWVLAMLTGFAVLPIARLAVPSGEVAALASRAGLSAYDASYLWLAMSRDAELVTLDQKLLRADRALRGEPS
jgi:predicted nucleic acid-binding protein